MDTDPAEVPIGTPSPEHPAELDEPLDLRRIASAIHATRSEADGPRLVRVRTDPGRAELELGTHALSGPLPHPLDHLVGFRAPSWWDAAGITTSGTLHHTDGSGPSERTLVTALTDRGGNCVSVIGPEGAVPQIIEDPPTGWSADVLRRILGLATEPPEASPALLMDLWWIDALAADLLAHPRRRRSWRTLARAHPLCPPNELPDPEDLATLTANDAIAHPWWFLRERMADAPLPASSYGPQGEGAVLALGDWFDDGSLCRWTMRNLPPADVLLPDLLSDLPDHLADALLAGLVEVEGAPAA